MNLKAALAQLKDLGTEEFDRLVRSITFSQVADWINEMVSRQTKSW